MEVRRLSQHLLQGAKASSRDKLIGLSRSIFSPRRCLATASAAQKPPLVLSEDVDGVRVLKMNNPKRLNAWTQSMMKSFMSETDKAIKDDSVKAVVFTGTGRYYCAGVDLGSTLRPMMPKALHETIRTMNESVFNTFLTFPKPMVIGKLCTFSMTKSNTFL